MSQKLEIASTSVLFVIMNLLQNVNSHKHTVRELQYNGSETDKKSQKAALNTEQRLFAYTSWI